MPHIYADNLEDALFAQGYLHAANRLFSICLLYTSDAADDLLCVDLGGRRIIKKKKTHVKHTRATLTRQAKDT
mgnify:CR=1 FL=1